MGYGLVTDDRSREEGRHYTDQCGARLHARGASDETKRWNTRRYRRRACAGTALLWERACSRKRCIRRIGV